MATAIAFVVPGTDILVDNRVHNYTDFQLKMMLRISQFEGFQRFVTHNHTSLQIKAERKIVLTWYADNKLHSLRVGRNRVLEAIQVA